MNNNKISLKSIFSSLLMLAFVLVLAACGNDEASTTEEIPTLNTNLTDELVLELDYEGKNYKDDRIGEVSLSSCTDGDTADFSANGDTFSVRFLNVDTPETKGALEPWGTAASDYVCDKLENADTIVLEGRTVMTDTYGRNLAFVWYDGRLLNLELVEQAYSRSDSGSDESYGELFQQAEANARATGKRVFGETDPNFSYGITTFTLEYLREDDNMSDNMGNKIKFTGVVTKRIAGDAFVQLDGFGVYLYLNHSSTTKLTIGNLVTVEGTIAEYNGAHQIIGVTRNTVTVEEEGRLDLIQPTVITIPDITKALEGSLLELNDVEITDHYVSSNGAENITVKDDDGNTIVVRIHQNIAILFTDLSFTVGDTIDVTAPLSQYNGEYQLMLTSVEDIEIK